MCGRYSRGKATWLTTLLIKTCRPAFVCVRACVHTLCVFYEHRHAFFSISARACVRLVNVFVTGTRGTSESGQRCCL